MRLLPAGLVDRLPVSLWRLANLFVGGRLHFCTDGHRTVEWQGQVIARGRSDFVPRSEDVADPPYGAVLASRDLARCVTMVLVDNHQRAMWVRMLDRIVEFNIGTIDIKMLVSDLRGLYVEADPHDKAIQSEFEFVWGEIDMEMELRTEAWAPRGSASDERLTRGLEAFGEWVRRLLAADRDTEHG